MPCGCVLIAYLGLHTIWDGTPRTIRYEIDSWQNHTWGLHNIDRQRHSCEVAVATDGSRRNRCQSEVFKHYFILDRRLSFDNLYLRSTNSAFSIDHPARAIDGGPCTCTWQPLKALLSDGGDCQRTAEARLPGAEYNGTGQVSGHPVVHYRVVETDGSTTDLSLAPGLACEVMEEVSTLPGTLGIPGAKWHYRVTSYKSGEPDASLFQLPAGHTIQPGMQ